jgi:Zn-dependent protease
MLEIVRRHLWDGTAGGFAPLLTEEQFKWIILGMAFVAVIIATTVHEFGHAWMADRLGDPTPREQGRVSLSPLAHMDPLGTLLLLATLLIGFPVGWGRPVRTNPENYKCGQRLGIGLTAVAGPVMNLLTAIILAPIARYLINGGGRTEADAFLLLFLLITVLVNLSLFCFNLVPVAPLDGSHITASLLPEGLSLPYRRFMTRYGSYVLLGLMISGKLGEWLGPIILALFCALIGIRL